MKPLKVIVYFLLALPLMAMQCSGDSDKLTAREYLSQEDMELVKSMTPSKASAFEEQKKALYLGKREWENGEYEKSFVYFENALPDTQAKFYLSEFFLQGKFTAKDTLQALKLLNEAADADNTQAMLRLVELYGDKYVKEFKMFDPDAKETLQKVLDLSYRAAELGSVESMLNLAEAHRVGRVLPHDFKKALEWYQKAADLGDASAIHNIGVFYFNGLGVEQDFAEAESWYKKASEKGFFVASYNLGYMYYQGNYGIERDYEKAVHWFKIATEQGDMWSPYYIGLIYKEGKGFPKDKEKARKWFQTAKDAGLDLAEDELKKLDN